MTHLPTNLFNHMATPQNADVRLQPPSAEAKLNEYLERLSGAVAAVNFAVDAGVQAIVFGEWGHGKSQTLYRTDAHLRRNHPGVLTIRVVAAEMDAEGVLRAVQQAVTNLAPEELAPLVHAGDALASVEDEAEAMQVVANALAETAHAARRLHTAILFDEVQTMDPQLFQTFLETLRDRFNEMECCVHTLQCHSLSSIGAAQKIAGMLGDWLAQGCSIQLPSLSSEVAQIFYRQRVLDFGGSETLAENLVPEGVARTLCEMAGGNPRNMLILARKVAYQMEIAEETQFTPEVVLAVLEQEAGAEAGSRLFLRRRYDAILDLLPQEWMGLGETVAGWLRREFPAMFVGRRRYTATELFGPPLKLDAQQAQNLSRNVDGVPLFSVVTDEEIGITEYTLSEALRERVSSPWGSTGTSLKHKEAQFGLVLQPHRYQRAINSGIVRLLQVGGFAARPHLAPLGTAESGEPLSGHRFLARIRGPRTQKLDLFVPVLITSMFGAPPSQSMCDAIQAGLKDGAWRRVFLFFYDSDHTWEQWLSTQVGESRLGEGRGIACLEHEHWATILKTAPTMDGQPEDLNVKALRFYSELYAAHDELDVACPSEHQDSLASHVTSLVESHHMGLDELTYLPDATEQALLSNPELGAPRTLKELGDSPKWTQRMLLPMEGQYLEKVGAKWCRLPPTRDSLYTGVLRILKAERAQKIGIQAIQVKIEQELVFPDAQGGRLPSALEWVLNLLVSSGQVDRSPDLYDTKYSYYNLDKVNRDSARELKKALKNLAAQCRAIAKYSSALGGDVSQRATHLGSSLKEKKGASPVQVQLHLASLSQDVEQLNVDVARLQAQIQEELTRKAGHILGSLEQRKRDREGLPDVLREFVLNDSTWRNLVDSVTEFADALKPPATLHGVPSGVTQSSVDSQSKVVGRRLQEAASSLDGTQSSLPGKRGELVRCLLKFGGEGSKITVEWSHLS